MKRLDRVVPLSGQPDVSASFEVVIVTVGGAHRLRLMVRAAGVGIETRTMVAREDIGPNHPFRAPIEADPANALRLWAADQIRTLANAWDEAGGGQ